MNAKPVLRAAALWAAAALCSACTVTTIDRGDGRIETTYALLSAVSDVNVPAEGAYVETRGVGVASVAGQTSIGLFDVEALSLAPGCRLVVVSASDEQIKAWRELLRDSGPICSKRQPRGDKTP